MWGKHKVDVLEKTRATIANEISYNSHTKILNRRPEDDRKRLDDNIIYHFSLRKLEHCTLYMAQKSE